MNEDIITKMKDWEYSEPETIRILVEQLAIEDVRRLAKVNLITVMLAFVLMEQIKS